MLSEQTEVLPGETLLEITAYELYSGVKGEIRDRVRQIIENLGSAKIAGPVSAMVLELADNALKALYKYVFYEYAIKETGLGDLPFEQWNEIFKNEIETNYAKNFERVCREQSLAMIVRLSQAGETLRIDVVNDGAPEPGEYAALRRLLKETAKSQSIRRFIGTENNDAGDDAEIPGLGWTLVFLTLKGLGLSPHHFHFIVGKNRTTARIELPLRLFEQHAVQGIRLLEPGPETDAMVSRIFAGLKHGIVVFNEAGDVLQVSASVLESLGLKPTAAAKFPGLLKPRFSEDIFSGPFNVTLLHRFDNYRLRVPTADSARELLFNISGIYNPALKEVETYWQLINLAQDTVGLSEGSIFENVHLQSIVRPYIPGMILEKARESLRHGLFRLPNEHRELTIFFLDLIGFTEKSEQLEPTKVIDLLNLSLGIVVKSIEMHHGYIDKFMGDGIMAVFSDPLEAVISGFEIQNNFAGLNAYREISGEDSIEMRIGINTGMVILGSVGTRKRMDWTALGDAVNTASRIEKSGKARSVLVSDSTYQKIKSQVCVGETFAQKVKGKQKEILVHFLRSVSYAENGVQKRLEL